VNIDKSCVTQPKGDISASVYDGGGERIPETPPEVTDKALWLWGDRIALERIPLGMDGRKPWKACQVIYVRTKVI